MNMNELLQGRELHDALERAGVIPPMCEDLIIQVPCAGFVTIHEVRMAPRKLMEVIGASVVPAKLVTKEDDHDKFEDMTGKKWWQRSKCPNDGSVLVGIPNGGMTCPKCHFHLDTTDADAL